MPERKSMRRIKECLRLHFEAKLSQQAISRSLQIARSTVQDYLSRVERIKKSWTELKDLADELTSLSNALEKKQALAKGKVFELKSAVENKNFGAVAMILKDLEAII